LATVARFCARPALRAAAEEMETEAATEADILALVGVVEREGRPARNPTTGEKRSWMSAVRFARLLESPVESFLGDGTPHT
jgi:hypothetical protein